MKKNTTLLKSINILFIGTALNVLISAITTPILTRMVSPSVYGELSVFNMYSSIAYIVLMLGLDHAYVRFFYKENSIDYKKYLLFSCIKFPLSIAVIITLLSGIIPLVVNSEAIGNFNIALLFCINVLILIVNRYGMLTLRLENNNVAYSMLTVINKVIFVLVAVIFVIKVDIEHLQSLIIATITAGFIATAFSIIMSREIWFNKSYIHKSNGIQKELYRYGFPLIFSGLATWLLNGIDKIMLNYYISYEQVGVFAAAMNIVGLFSVVQITFNTLWVPITMKQYEKNPDDTSVYIKGNDIISFISFSIGITIVLFKDIIVLMLGDAYREASTIIPFLLLIPIMTMISETTIVGVNFKNKTYWHVVITVISCVVNVIANIFLIPKLGILGAAVSTGISYIVFFVMRTIAGMSCYRISFNLSRIYFCLVVFLLFSAYAYNHNFDIILITGYTGALIIFIALYRKTIREILVYIKKTLSNK